MIDGVLEEVNAEGYATSKIKLDFSEVAIEERKLRFHQLGELANLKVGFDGDPIDTFQAIVEGRVSIPGVQDAQTDDVLAEIEAAGAIYKNSSDIDPNAPWQFQLRTASLFELPEEIVDRLASATVDRPATTAIEKDDIYENNDTWQSITEGHAADFGLISAQITRGGQDPANLIPIRRLHRMYWC